ncbi:ABC transporter permease [uncultured Anaerococcus sp.]|uniref:ABC transporter permease n=1 Tax=uncultured Anaerococcus sp. TaxID=293428 RepID=UPI0026136645|nr:ABC transporter permease [uncultured Anaerococcus sp.]
MTNLLKAELIKEKRSANFKLLLLVPIGFLLFNLIMGNLMAQDTEGRSYLIATSFNWFPLLILPIVISLLVINIIKKEKQNHIDFQKSLGIDNKRTTLAKSIVVILELFIVVFLSSIIIYLIGGIVLGQNINLSLMLKAGLVLFVGSLPILGISFCLMRFFNKGFLIIILNFILSLISPIPAVSHMWELYPYSYSIRMLAPIVGVHPNGTFLEKGSELWNLDVIPIAMILSFVIFAIFIGLACIRKDKENA